MQSLDSRRFEKRLLLHERHREALLCLLHKHGLRERRFRRQCVKTMYLIDDPQTRTFDDSFRARQRRMRTSPAPSLSGFRGKFLCTSSTGAHGQKVKSAPIWLPLKEAVLWAKEASGLPSIRPYFLVRYRREHFGGSKKSFRVTVDHACEFFLFLPEKNEAAPLSPTGEEGFFRVEIKFARRSRRRAEIIAAELAALGAIPVISKKGQALDLAGTWFANHFGIKDRKERELRGKAVEVKLTLEHGKLEDAFAALILEKLPALRDKTYPFVITTTTCNCYWGWKRGAQCVEGARATLQGANATLVSKTGSTLLDAELGIIERAEVKRPGLAYSGTGGLDEFARLVDPSWQYVGALFRFKKSVWLADPRGRMFRFSLDQCAVKERPEAPLLHQIEIEYTGRRLDKGAPAAPEEARGEILASLRDLARVTIAFCAARGISIIRKGEEKFSWLVDTLAAAPQ